ncbi:MAG: 4-vinyl reductase [Anaerolineae bacterium]
MVMVKIPWWLVAVLVAQIEETLGRRSSKVLLRQAGLSRHAEPSSPGDEIPGVTVEEYARLLAKAYEALDPQRAPSIFFQAGKQSAIEMRRQRPAQSALAGTALRLLPADRRLRRILERLAEEGETLYGTPHHLREETGAFFVELANCPHCAGFAPRQARQPVCHLAMGTMAETVTWAMGRKHLVEEVACIALGAEACRFRIAR